MEELRYKEKVSLSMKRSSQKEAQHTREYKKLLSAQSKAMWQDPDKREKLMAARKRQGEARKGTRRFDVSKHYIITHPDGHEETIHGLKPYCRLNPQYKLDDRTMFRVLKGELASHKGFKVRHAIPE
jgi:hypothetical protein